MAVAGHAHYIIQRGHSGQPVFADDEDRRAYLAALHEAALAQQVVLHAYALLDAEVQLLATPPSAQALSRMMQTLGRRYVSGYNRRHGSSGTLWDGRFRAAVVEPGGARLQVLLLTDGQPGQTSASHRTGGTRHRLLVDPPEIWGLGNTPFEREARYRTLLVQGVPPAEQAALRQAALGGWVIGARAFALTLQDKIERPALPRLRGRPARQGAAPK